MCVCVSVCVFYLFSIPDNWLLKFDTLDQMRPKLQRLHDRIFFKKRGSSFSLIFQLIDTQSVYWIIDNKFHMITTE